MGLDLFTNEGHVWSRSYTTWDNVCEALAKAAEWPVGGDGRYQSSSRINWADLGNDGTDGTVWEEPGQAIPEDPLVILMVHADDHGILPWKVLRPLADRIKPLVDLIPDGDADGYDGAWVRAAAGELLAAIESGDKAGSDLEFA